MMRENLLTEERRARMAAERMLAQKEAELHEANRKLSRHAVALSEDLVETRGVVAVVKDENTRVRADLERANEEVSIAKRRLWNSIQSVRDGFAVFDADNRLVIANAAYLAPFDGLECIRPGVHYEEVVEALLAEGIVDIEHRTPAEWRADMLARWHSPAPAPEVIKLWDGAFIRLVEQRAPGGDTVCLGLNITEAMQREAALTEATEKAEAANRAKSAFLANMSHEIRTPMNGVVAMADLMAEGDLEDEQRLYVDTIRNSGQALLSIINDVLDYSKIEAEKLVLRPEPFDLEHTILDVFRLLQPTIREKNLHATLDYDIFLPTRYEGDPLRVRQVLTNLIGNAVKFTAEGQVLVRVVGVPEGTGAERLHITVEDTGIGVPADKLDHVFGEFNQVEDERNRSYEGTGLGLAITRQLVELMGGQVWVESDEGVGSCFGISLPMPVAETTDLPPLPTGLTRALVVMEDGLDRTILERRLIALGLLVRCEVAGQGAEGPADVVFAEAGADLPDLPGVPVIAVARPDRPAPESDKASMVLRLPIARHDLTSALAALDPAASARAAATDAPRADTPVTATPVFGSIRRRAPVSPPDGTGAQPSPTAGTARRMRVLMAEDNKTNRLVFSKLVKTRDLELVWACNGHEAVAAFEAGPVPDLIFMDISMPGMDGKEATRKIRQIEADKGLPATRIVALTAHAMQGDGDEIMAHGLDAYLTKPFDKAAILSEIDAACPAEARTIAPELA